MTGFVIEAPDDDGEGARSLNDKVCDVSAGQFLTIPSLAPAVPPIEYTKPCFQLSTAILAPSGTSYRTLADLRGKRVLVLMRDEHTIALARSAGLRPQQATPSDSIGPLASGGHADAAILDSAVALAAQKTSNGRLTTTTGLGPSYGVVFAVRKGNTVLRTQLDAALTDAGHNGQYAAAYREWFAGQPAYVP